MGTCLERRCAAHCCELKGCLTDPTRPVGQEWSAMGGAEGQDGIGSRFVPFTLSRARASRFMLERGGTQDLERIESGSLVRPEGLVQGGQPTPTSSLDGNVTHDAPFLGAVVLC